MELAGPTSLACPKVGHHHCPAFALFLLGVAATVCLLAALCIVARALLRRPLRREVPPRQYRELLLPSGALVRVPVQ